MNRSYRLRCSLGWCSIVFGALGLVQCGGDDDEGGANGGSAGASKGGAAGSSGSATGGKLTQGGSASGGKTNQGGSNPGGAQPGGTTGEGGNAGGEATGGGGIVVGGGGAGGAPGGTGGDGGAGGGPSEAEIRTAGYFIGSFAPLTGYTGISGQALLVRRLDAGTEVSVQVLGLQPNTQYPVHVHAAPCAQGAGGGHYKIDPSIAGTEATNELWLPLTTDANGIGNSSLEHLTHMARGDALSIVVHDPAVTGTPKMACADLWLPTSRNLHALGIFASFAQAETVDTGIGGTARLTRQATATQVEFSVKGLDPTATYSAHIHALPCAVTAAGGHYKRDTTISATEETNELWVPLGNTSTGTANGIVDYAHVARYDAQSMVIHRMGGTGGTTALKVACADLVVPVYPPLRLQGDAVPFAAAAERGYATLTASARLTREITADTRVILAVSGLTAHSVYPTHVHNLPCAVQSGGGHYKRDNAVTTAVESNEVWLTFTGPHEGSGVFNFSTSGILRADARSIVIHDSATDAARLACIDLAP